MANEPVAELRPLLASSLPGSVRSVEVIERGHVKRTYRAETDTGVYAVYIPRSETSTNDLRIEAAVCRYARTEMGLPAPEVVASNFDDSGSAFFATKWIPGDHVSIADPVRRRQRVAHDIGRTLGRMHWDSDFDRFGRLTSPEGHELEIETATDEWRTWLATYLHDALDRLAHTGFASVVPEARSYVERRIDDVANAEPVLHHDDYNPNNVLVDGDSVVGIVDWADAYAVAPAYSLTHTEEWFDDWFVESANDPVRDVLFAGYSTVQPLANDFREHRQFYRIVWAIDHLDVVQGVHHGNVPRPEVDRHIGVLENRLQRARS